MPSPERAQSSLQLLLHFQRSGASSRELCVLRDAYLLTMQLNSGLVTGGGKPTITHCVGAASLAFHYGAPFDVMTAAILHDAYLVGDWGRLRRGLGEENRAEVRAIIGDHAESLVHGFALLPTRTDGIAALASRPEPYTETERNVVRVKMLELLDHLLDLGSVLFFRNTAKVRAHFVEQGEHLCRLAERCELPGLRDDIAEAIDHTLTAELPPELVGLAYPGDSVPLVMPRSCRRRPELVLGRALAKTLRRVIPAQQSRMGYKENSR